MALTRAEQAELDQLEKEVGQSVPKPTTGLSASEQAEMKQLEGEVGHLAPDQTKMFSFKNALYSPEGGKAAKGIGKSLGYLGGQVRTGLAGLAGVAGPQDYAAASRGEAPGMAEYYERGGVPEGPAINTPLGRLSARGVGGFLSDIATDPTTLLFAKGGVKAPTAMEAVGSKALTRTDSALPEITQSLKRPGADQIRAASKALNVTPTKGMLTSDYATRGLENSLSQSPTVPGQLVRSAQDPIYDAMNDRAMNLVKDASGESVYSQGKELKSSAAKAIEDRYAPIQSKFQDIEQSTKHIPLYDESLKRVSRNVRNIDEAQLFPNSKANKIADSFANAIESATNVKDLQTIRSQATRIANDINVSAEEKHVASMIIDKVDRLHKNSVMRGAISTARELEPGADVASGQFISKGEMSARGTREGENVGRQLIKDVKSARGEYRDLMGDINTLGEGSGLVRSRPGLGPQSAISDLKGAVSEDVPKAIFDTGNYDYLTKLQAKFPESFEQARQAKLAELVSRSQAPNGKLSIPKFLKNTEKFGPEVKQMLFGQGGVEDLGNIGTLSRALPERVGASDTPRGLMFSHFTDPYRNLLDIGNYAAYKAKGNIAPTARFVGPPLKQGLIGGRDRRQGLVAGDK